MSYSGLNLKTGTSRLSYHLKMLLNAGFVAQDPVSRKYSLTELGKGIARLISDLEGMVEREASRPFVRTSNFTLERFDRKRLTRVLMREAGMPRKIAGEIAKEVEDRISGLGLRCVASSEIREMICAILLERRMEEYRRLLTKLGMTVYGATRLIRKLSEMPIKSCVALRKSLGDRILEEYLFIKVLPDRLFKERVSGLIYMNHAECWTLSPESVQYDLRTVLEHSLIADGEHTIAYAFPPPNDLKGALNAVRRIIAIGMPYLPGGQGIDHFNVFLAPYVGSMGHEVVKRYLAEFLSELNCRVSDGVFVERVALALDSKVPSMLEGATSRIGGDYGDYDEEAKLVLKALIEAYLDPDHLGKPISLPSIVVKVYEDEADDWLIELLVKAIMGYVPLHIVNMSLPWQKPEVSYGSCLFRYDSSWTGDWELDTLRTGIGGVISVNLPKLAFMSNDESSFFSLLAEVMEDAIKLLTIKRDALKDKMEKGFIPFLLKEGRLAHVIVENLSYVISPIGLNEASLLTVGNQVFEHEDSLSFSLKVVKFMNEILRDHEGNMRLRLGSISPDGRVLKLSRAGPKAPLRSKKGAMGGYTVNCALPLSVPIPLGERLRLEGMFHELTPGGHVLNIHLAPLEYPTEYLRKLLNALIRDFRLGASSPVFDYTYCHGCRRVLRGLRRRCHHCSFPCLAKVVSYGKPLDVYEPIASLDKLSRDEYLARHHYGL